jgi:N-acyl-D-amino-acid deacylase
VSGSRGTHGSTLAARSWQMSTVRLTPGLKLNSCLKLRSKLKHLIRGVMRSLLRARRRLAIVALGALCWSASSALLADTLITNARIIDGTGSAAMMGSVRLSGDRITAVGKLTPNESDEITDAGGLVLTPGFIDTHSHSDRLILTERDAQAKITQGITTAVVGQDGDAPYPLADFFAALEATPAKINIAAYAGHNTLRDEVMGADFKRPASDEEIETMSALLEQELAAGALGLSTGLEYEPGIHSETREVVRLAQLTADAGGRYISHVRSEDRWFEDALEEIIEIGRVTGMPVQISHLKLAMASLWGRADEILARLNAAREEGIDLTADLYPYTYWQSNMMVLLPERDPLDLDAIDFVMAELAPPDGIIFTHFPAEPGYVGMTLTEIAGVREQRPSEAFSALAKLSIAHEAATGEMGDMMIGTSMRDDDIAAFMAWPHTNICTDGSLRDRHPRGAGSFPRVLGLYVREQGVLTLEGAIHRMTGLAAQHMGFAERGVIAPGMMADLVLVNPDSVMDRATTSEPFAPSEGIHSVWVAGERILHEGEVSEAFPGRVIRRASPQS